MPTEVTNMKCPSCTGPLRFDEKTGKLQCDYCGSSFEPALVEQLYADKEKAAAAETPEFDTASAGGQWEAGEAEKLRAYNCPSCGAQLICDDTTAATSCPYCGNPTVVPGKFSGDLRPDCIIPFGMTRDEAAAALKQFYKGKPLLPRFFAAQNHVDEIKGVYVPFWLFDADTESDIVFSGTKTRVYESGDDTVTETRHYRVARSGRASFEKVPVDGSSKMPDGHMDAVEPFDYSKLTDFSSAYLPGFLAEKYDVDAETSAQRANERIENSTLRAFERTCDGYDSLTPDVKNIRLENSSVKYALLPVWLLSTKWNGKNFLFAMNGQTGKLVGELPVSMGKFWLWFAGIALPLMAILGFIEYM